MTEKNDDDQMQAATPCHRCVVIRFFLMAVAGVALTYVLSPDTFKLIEGLSTLTLAVYFVGGLGLLAVGKAVLELFASDRHDD
ncbi:disulfide bond formation protein B [Marivita sp.]|uniref:disulfide bond formation protein B n=1 Tax=Marivita sp. TaxID=2003365 RepID=UPI0025BFA555|nr:disulfide bond formation protein B [Marivita sp.]